MRFAPFALLALLAASPARAQTPAAASAPAVDGASSPAARRALEFLKLLDAGDRAAARAYIRDNYAPALLADGGVDGQLADFGFRHHFTRHARFVRFAKVTPTAVEVVYFNDLMRREQFQTVEVEAAAPHRISGLGDPIPRDLPDQAPVARTDRQRIAAIDRHARRLADADFFSGVILLARGDRPIYTRAFGQAERRFAVPNRTDTQFHLGSITKTFTAVAIAQLVEQGKLAWDDPLGKFIPDFPNRESAGKIRIEHLLTHTSGLGPLFPSGRINPDVYRGVADFLAAASRDPPAFEPGTRYQYSNVGYVLLGRIVEIVSGEDYYDYLRRHIFEPAGMTAVSTAPRDHLIEDLAYGYEPKYGLQGAPYRDHGLELPARAGPHGGSSASAGSLFRFDRALRSGALIRRETWARMTAPRPELHAPERGYGFAVGASPLLFPARKLVGHGGNTSGVCTAWATVEDTSPTYTVIVLANSGSAACFAINDLIFSVLPKPTTP